MVAHLCPKVRTPARAVGFLPPRRTKKTAMADSGPSAPCAPGGGTPPLLGLDTDKLNPQKKNANNLVAKDKAALQPNGLYCLDLLRDRREPVLFEDAVPKNTCDSYMLLVRDFGSYDGFEPHLKEMIGSMKKRKQTPNPMNRNTNVRRRQCTYGADYAFSNQEFDRLPLDDDDHPPPRLVMFAIEAVRSVVRGFLERGLIHGVEPEDYNGVHCNWYGQGDVEINAHQDDERGMIEGAPIFSLTYLAKIDEASPKEALPREFEVCTPEYQKNADGVVVRNSKGQPVKKSFKRVAGVTLAQGDLLVMGGKMQKEWYHRLVAPKPAADYTNTQRINLTVRAFNEETVAKMKARLEAERAGREAAEAIEEAKRSAQKLADAGK